MSLSHEQQKNIHSLLDTSGVGAYEEVRDELYDHLVQAVESYMTAGLSFTDAQHTALADMGGTEGLVAIERAYIRSTEQEAWRLCKTYIPAYLQSFRWLGPLAISLTLQEFIPEEYFLWTKFTTMVVFLLAFYFPARRWNYSLQKKEDIYQPVSLRASMLMQYGTAVPGLVFTIGYSPTENFPFGLALAFTIVSVLAFVVADFYLAFRNHATSIWQITS